jgi:RNA polymerase sigma factor (TIGR02999 family)
MSAGKREAEEQLFPLLYEELHDLAQRFMRQERKDHTLQTTALIHEAYIHLGGGKDSDWESKSHFLRVAARAMRRVLVSHARRKRSDKREGMRQREPLDEELAVLSHEPSAGLIDLDEALNQLAVMDPQTGQVFELRYFGGLTADETGRIMGISIRTVMREWKIARAWLANKIG